MNDVDSTSHGDRPTVLVVDDEVALRTACRLLLRQEGFMVAEAESGEEALAKLESVKPQVVVTDVRMAGMDGLALLGVIKERMPRTEVIVVTGYGTVETAVEAIRKGAYHFLLKPIDPIELLSQTVQKAYERWSLVGRIDDLEQQVSSDDAFESMIGRSPQMQRVFALISNIGSSEAPVLVLGESGTGKDLVARALHARSNRSACSYVALNCATLQEHLVESELFGHVRGAFSGAVVDKQGLLEAADGGTLFLDEIAELAPGLQAKLLRAIETGEIRRVGDVRNRTVDVRIIAATNQNLEEAVADHRFRADLMYRLNVFTVTVPPLRDRPGDIDLLVTRFLQRFGSGTKTGVTAEALELLHTYDWPGNVRELQNIIQYATTVASGSQVTLKDLPERILTRRREPAPSQTFDDFMDESYVDARASFLGQFERWYARHRLEQAEGNVSHAARAAGMDRSNFRRMAKRCGVLSEDT